jgi:hypothetical protein
VKSSIADRKISTKIKRERGPSTWESKKNVNKGTGNQFKKK